MQNVCVCVCEYGGGCHLTEELKMTPFVLIFVKESSMPWLLDALSFVVICHLNEFSETAFMTVVCFDTLRYPLKLPKLVLITTASTKIGQRREKKMKCKSYVS